MFRLVTDVDEAIEDGQVTQLGPRRFGSEPGARLDRAHRGIGPDAHEAGRDRPDHGERDLGVFAALLGRVREGQDPGIGRLVFSVAIEDLRQIRFDLDALGFSVDDAPQSEVAPRAGRDEAEVEREDAVPDDVLVDERAALDAAVGIAAFLLAPPAFFVELSQSLRPCEEGIAVLPVSQSLADPGEGIESPGHRGDEVGAVEALIGERSFVVAAEPAVSVFGAMLGDAVAVLVPGLDILLDGQAIEFEKSRVRDIGRIAGPQELPPAGVEDVEVGRQVVPEVFVALVVHRGGPVPLVDLPVGAIIARRADAAGELAEHVAVESGQAERVGARGLV